MKNFKKLLSIILLISMIFSMGMITVSAEETTTTESEYAEPVKENFSDYAGTVATGQITDYSLLNGGTGFSGNWTAASADVWSFDGAKLTDANGGARLTRSFASPIDLSVPGVYEFIFETIVTESKSKNTILRLQNGSTNLFDFGINLATAGTPKARIYNGSSTLLSETALDFSVGGTVYKVIGRFEVADNAQGNIKVKVFDASSAEPENWDYTLSDVNLTNAQVTGIQFLNQNKGSFVSVLVRTCVSETPDTPEGDGPTPEPEEPDNSDIEDLVFDMDMSTTAFSDKTGNVINVTNTGEVPVKYYKGYDGSTVPYAYFKNDAKNCLSIAYNQYAEGAKKSIKNKQTTVEMWARIDAVGKNGADFFTTRIPSATKELFKTEGSFWVAELTAKGELYNDALRTSAKYVNMTNAGIDHKEWNHYVFTRDVTVDENDSITSVTYKTYINGVEKIANTGTPNETTIDNDTTCIYFGSSIAANSMAGGISEVKIYNTVKTASEIKELYKEDEGIYRDKSIVDFNPTTIADSKGLIKTLSSNSRYTLPVAKTWVNPSSGEVVPYMSLEVEDSTNGNYGIGIGQGEIKGGDITKLTKLPETSVEMWLKHEHSIESSGSPVPFSFGGRIGFWLEMGARNGRKDAYIMLRNGSDDILLEKNYTGIPEKDDDPYNDWVHVVITRKWDKEAGTVDFTGYVDGTPMDIKIPQYTDVTDISADVTEVSFGDGWNVESFYDGGFAKIKIYDTILTAQRVADIYNEEKSSFREFGSEQLVQIEFTDNEGIVMPRVNGSNNSKYYWATRNAVSGSFKSVAGPTVVYSDYNAEPYGDIAIDSSNQAEAMTAVSANSATIEMWVRPENVTVDKPTTLFSVNQNAAGNPATQSQWRAGITNGELKLYGAGETNSEYKGTTYSGTDISSYYGQWIHLLFTRDVDTAVNSVVYKAYINGELAQTKTQSATELVAENSIYINTKQNKNYGMNEFSTFQGDVAKINIYSGTTNDDFALFKYNKEKDLYTVAPDEKITVSGVGFYTDDDYVEEFPVNAALLGVEATLTNSTEEDKAYLFAVGLYDGNKLVDLFMINDTVNNLGSPYIEIEDLSQYNLSQNAYVKLFVWYDGEDNGLIPCESNEEVMEISAQGGA